MWYVLKSLDNIQRAARKNSSVFPSIGEIAKSEFNRVMRFPIANL